jgi:hypothetical protein
VLRGVYAVFRGGFHTSGEPAIHRGSASEKAITVFFFGTQCCAVFMRRFAVDFIHPESLRFIAARHQKKL